MALFFTDREQGVRTPTNEVISDAVWGGLYVLFSARVADHSFGFKFPDQCPDGYGICGHDDRMLRLSVAAQLPEIEWPLSSDLVPPTPAILDLIEFIAASIGHPVEDHYHSFFRHSHLSFDREKGLDSFIADVNALFVRNGIAYKLTSDGTVRRILPLGLSEILASTVFRTGDAETDRLLETARSQILSPHEDARRDALEKLWDAFERVKTLEPGRDKRAQADALLDKVAMPSRRFRGLLADEAKALTDIGNSYRIRHSETAQEILQDSREFDYLFTRMFAYVRLLLKASGRGG
jgi:hypothetical protein